jgi:major vault protein
LRAVRDFGDKKAGDEWLFKGPGTYIPRVEVQVVEIVRAIIIKPNEALRLKARRPTSTRKAGEEWLIRVAGAYLPEVEEEVRETVKAYILTAQRALHLEALDSFVDVRGTKRNVGEQWLVTVNDASTHIPDVYERVVGEVNVTTLTSRQYCVVLDPVDSHGRNQLGKRELRKGETSFFLNPGERLEGGRPQNVYVLDSEEALLLCARESLKDGKEHRCPGDRWMIFGPTDYVPPVAVDVLEKRRAIPLDKNEGIYVRDIKSGRVRAVTGQSYMLSSYEELWKKDCPAIVETLLAKEITRDRVGAGSSSSATRDPTRVITYRTPHNSAVQVYDYKSKHARVVFGPDLVMLGPDEQFTVNSLSGDVPKKAHVIQSLALLLGPDFMTDVVVVETSDHARLSLKLSYNWYFMIDKEKPSKIFSVPDFVGDACKAIASRVRGAVATETFDNFHKKSADIIRDSVFGRLDSGEPREEFLFDANNLVITNIDIQSVEPVDSRTRDALQKSVQLAIEITTKSQEASARHEAERREQVARGKLERQKIKDEASSEQQRTELLKLQAASAVIEASGQATAEAHAKAESMAIEGEASVRQAELAAEAEKIKVQSELAQKVEKQKAHLSHQSALNDLEIQKAKDLAKIEADKFKGIIDAVGSDIIASIATAGPTQQAELLTSLKLESFMVTDGNTPVNLFKTAQGLIGV